MPSFRHFVEPPSYVGPNKIEDPFKWRNEYFGNVIRGVKVQAAERHCEGEVCVEEGQGLPVAQHLQRIYCPIDKP